MRSTSTQSKAVKVSPAWSSLMSGPGDRTAFQNLASRSLQEDWAGFDKETHQTNTFMGVTSSPKWSLLITSPFPDVWPPNEAQSFSYYAFGTYQTFNSHGPSHYLSAPWARVILKKMEASQKILLSYSIEATVSGRSSRPLSSEQARKWIGIQDSDPDAVERMLHWTRLPDETDPALVKLRAYYCQSSRDYPAMAASPIREITGISTRGWTANP